jgi:hypothetical protein
VTDEERRTRIARLVEETRAARTVLHDLVARATDDRAHWARSLATIARRPRLKSWQRERLAPRLSAILKRPAR